MQYYHDHGAERDSCISLKTLADDCTSPARRRMPRPMGGENKKGRLSVLFFSECHTEVNIIMTTTTLDGGKIISPIITRKLHLDTYFRQLTNNTTLVEPA
jgi:hypothetical protein